MRYASIERAAISVEDAHVYLRTVEWSPETGAELRRRLNLILAGLPAIEDGYDRPPSKKPAR